MAAPPPPAAGPPASSNSTSINDSVRNASETTLRRLMRFTNFGAAAFMIAAGIVGFIAVSLSVAVVLTAIYVILFGILILLFDFRLKRFDLFAYKWVGFLFSASGRSLFQLFVGTLAFGLGTLGIICGIYCILNVIFVYYVLRVHPTLSDSIERDNKTRQGVAAGVAGAQHAAAAAAATGTAAVAAGTAAATGAMNNAKAAAAGVTGGAGGTGTWEKLFDESTNRYYYYNASTKETRWDAPDQV